MSNQYDHNHNSWSSDPALQNIDPAKLQMLLSMADQAKGKNQTDLLPFLMSLGQSSSLNFSQEEMDSILNVLKIGKSPKELQKINRICTLLKQMRR